MQIESLKVYCDVARQRSFSQAAQASGITQSAVSQIVSQLEKRLHVLLIDRSTRPLQLTPQGMAYYEGCASLLQDYDELEARVRDIRVEVAGVVQVAAIYSISLTDMDHHTERFAAEAPQARVSLEYLHPDEVYARVLDGTADLGLVSFPRKSAKLSVVAWREEEMMLACAPQHRLASHLAVPLKEIEGETFIHFNKDLVIRRRVDRFLRSQGVTVRPDGLHYDNIASIKEAVASGKGVALLPAPTLQREVEAGTLAALPLFGSRFTRPIGVIHRRGQALSPAARRFMQVLLNQPAAASVDADTSPERNGHSRPSPHSRGAEKSPRPSRRNLAP
jgi:DNA-binding transcriptional LysR family regulator